MQLHGSNVPAAQGGRAGPPPHARAGGRRPAAPRSSASSAGVSSWDETPLGGLVCRSRGSMFPEVQALAAPPSARGDHSTSRSGSPGLLWPSSGWAGGALSPTPPHSRLWAWPPCEHRATGPEVRGAACLRRRQCCQPLPPQESAPACASHGSLRTESRVTGD